MSPAGGGADLEPPEDDDPKVQFRRFFEAVHRRLIGAAYLLTGNAEDAHDPAQEGALPRLARLGRGVET